MAALHSTPNASTSGNPLLVWDRLEIGPVKVEPRRLIAPYRLFYNGKEFKTDLIYTYEETVFEPGSLASQNLADMIGAQLALNYGLFCKQMIFHGTYDVHDQRFLIEMAENTSKEIYVKKILEPNFFLIGEAAHLRLKPEIKDRYLTAALLFPDSDRYKQEKTESWQTDTARHCILSSGGKDSLLSYAVINEIGYETFPFYVNESGRHWFTALNAYRHFNDHIPNTGRVWTNCDRVFVWMKRHMPFIRQDFARFRADEYPVRLWTVAVFLFGVLPLMRKYRIGRLLIGDEYDTTRVSSYEGIPHYDGLFDQSRYFDNQLSHYYQHKQWNIHQFSILRPVSEIMIQKILAERYPHLHMHQVSCHAAHHENGRENRRILPCGQCEKCRRIIGMLKAFGVPPSRCGYNESQVPSAIEGIVTRGINQESAGHNHIIHMLHQKGLVPFSLLAEGKTQPHPEVMRLRFDPECSPMNEIPEDLRSSIYRIYLEHAEGALERIGKEWKEKEFASGGSEPF
ncbi:MAG: hypothetical protein ACM3SY_17160 [Candidatus Omnitrophota bacterium]